MLYKLVTDIVFDTDYYCHKSVGTIDWQPGIGTKMYEPNWVVLMCDPGIVEYYAWLLHNYGKPVVTNKAFGAHISVVKGEQMNELADIYNKPASFGFKYAHTVRCDNSCHAWVDVWCPELHDFRSKLGLAPKTKMSFHLTIGRLK